MDEADAQKNKIADVRRKRLQALGTRKNDTSATDNVVAALYRQEDPMLRAQKQRSGTGERQIPLNSVKLIHKHTLSLSQSAMPVQALRRSMSNPAQVSLKPDKA